MWAGVKRRRFSIGDTLRLFRSQVYLRLVFVHASLSVSCRVVWTGVLDKAKRVRARVIFLYGVCFGLSWLATCSVVIGWLALLRLSWRLGNVYVGGPKPNPPSGIPAKTQIPIPCTYEL